MDLHELLDAAVADLPDAPDLLPEVRRSHRRRTVLVRRGTVAAAAALAVGAGTLTIAAPWHHSGGSGAASAATRPAALAAQPAQITRIPVDRRDSAPPLQGYNVAQTYTHVSYPGHVTVVDVWGSWCTACRADAPVFAQIADEPPAGVSFVGIDSWDSRPDGLAFQQRYGLAFPSLQDPDGGLTQAFGLDQGTVYNLPVAFVVDAHGRLAVTIVGVIGSAAELTAEIAYAQAG